MFSLSHKDKQDDCKEVVPISLSGIKKETKCVGITGPLDPAI